MSFYTSLSGLQAAQTSLSTISHNLANVSTNGFKKSRSEFADVIASNFTTDPRRMTGSGVTLQENRQLFGAGNLVTTGSSLDLAISGEGFFPVKTIDPSGALAYTRNGHFTVDPDQFIVDSQGARLQAYPVETDGTTPGALTLMDVKIPQTSGEATVTKNVGIKLNLNSASATTTAAFSRTDPATYSSATATTIYDSEGTAQTLTTYFVHNPSQANSTDSNWTVYSFVGDEALNNGNGQPVTFSGTGALTSPNGAINLAFAPVNGVSRTISFDLAGSTAAKQPFTVSSRTQDGVSLGSFAGITVDSGGIITASYSNGDTMKLGRVALANFTNTTGLRQQGTSYWASTGVSGPALLGTANQNGFGKLMSGTIEGSNVDVTEELVELIAAQRNFQANAKALDTASQISQTIFNIRS